MVGIGIDHISITRRMPIDAGMLAAVLARLRAETSGTIASWGLGERGSCDLDVTFRAAGTRSTAFETAAVLWNPSRNASAPVTVTASVCEAGESQLEIHPASPVGDWWRVHSGAYVDLAHAALEELAQEMLYQHARVRDELVD